MATMEHKAVALLLCVLLLSAAGNTSALGINCRGSSNCAFQSSHTLSEINTKVQAIPDGNIFSNGVHITCVGNICAFLQNVASPGTKTAAQIKGYVTNLLNHGCNVCGSDPTEPGNNVNNGQLTVNYVSNP
ncbi:hypothetical protein R1flu_013635 [Riccia fluitans]|uniref:Killer toxin Kp4 domain-containing protein n=1 Tax=Riccia fluitans TaxID=41844 RepID=A0ABD1YEX7_9MARC